MSKSFIFEREGQIEFFNNLKINEEVELIHNTDGVYKGTLFEFKLTIPDLNKALFQAIKYLSHLRIVGRPLPAQILLVALNEEKAYLYESSTYIGSIEEIYAGAASKNNSGFSAKSEPININYSTKAGLDQIKEILDNLRFTRVHIDAIDVVGWADYYYSLNPKASKSDLYTELRSPSQFKDYIYPWTGADLDFMYINDLLNARILKKELGAFYTPSPYCLKATELVRQAIKRLPKNHDYIILDRTAGTGNLEEFLTDRPVDEIIVGDLRKYIDDSLKTNYLKDKSEVIKTFYPGRFKDITIGELEKYKTDISLHDFLSDNEISHVIVNTYELKEWIVLMERFGNKVKLIIPPQANPDDSLVNGGDALSDHFIKGSGVGKLFIDQEYRDIIDEINSYVSSPTTNVILFENPPYRDEAAKVKNKNKSKTYVYDEFKKAGTNEASHRELANLFIWSGWNYYLKKPDDYFVLFSPIKYWKSLNLGEKKFIKGFLFNRHFFHAGSSAISCILWQNQKESVEELTLQAIDIDNKTTLETEDDEAIYLKNINIKKVHSRINNYKDDRSFDDDVLSDVYCDLDGTQSAIPTNKKSKWNKNIIGYLRSTSYNLDSNSLALTRTITYDALTQSYGFYLRSDNFIEKLPLFAAKLYPQKYWYQRDIYFTTADGGDKYLEDRDFLKSCFIFACLHQRNHCRSFDGSDGRFYKNELCFNDDTIATSKLSDHSLTDDERSLLKSFQKILTDAKDAPNYNPKYTYGTYQIDQELNTFKRDELTDKKIYDNPQLNTDIIKLKSDLAKYYESFIQPKLFEYELLK